jgi:hypothetical protein
MDIELAKPQPLVLEMTEPDLKRFIGYSHQLAHFSGVMDTEESRRYWLPSCPIGRSRPTIAVRRADAE